jgi:post-segregation antitoxin (ccd killing protein)
MARTKPAISITTLRIDVDLLERVRAAALENRRTLSAEISRLIEEALAHRLEQRAQVAEKLE